VHISEANAHKVVAVYRAHSLLASTIGSLPLAAFRGGPPGGEPWAGDQAGLLAYPGGRDEVSGIATQGSVSAMVFYETLVVHLLTWGNAYVVKVPNVARTRTVALELLLPNRVQPRWGRRTNANPSGKYFYVLGEDGQPEEATPADVIHIRAMGQDLLQGLSPIGAARQMLGLSVAAEEFGARLFGSGSLMSGVITSDAVVNEEQAEALKARWRAKITGLANAHDIAVLDNGGKFQPVSIPPEDSQFIQTREFAVTEIARLYGIPPHMLGQVEKSTSWGTGIAEQGIGFNIYTLRPWLSRIEQALSNELLPRGINCRFDVRELLRGDIKARYEAYQTGIQAGFVTINEARALEGLPPQPGGDELMFPMNYAALTTVAAPPDPALALPPVMTGGAANGSA
jgi:HK97 family phage portal protein